MVNMMTWTNEQWDTYEKSTVIVPLELFGRLLTAAEQLQAGSRLSKKDRLCWTDPILQARVILSAAANEIETTPAWLIDAEQAAADLADELETQREVMGRG